jgi:hypothetical protein
MAVLDVLKDPTHAELHQEATFFGFHPGDYSTNAALNDVVVIALVTAGPSPDAATAAPRKLHFPQSRTNYKPKWHRSRCCGLYTRARVARE